ncbi:hypothetical protein TPHA_0K00660 [Tetrapisispora phaffii CBS 4417]|uniref:Ribosomal protein S21 n=1 Tax=Tetrapisispora phaffii (strain ATCC 24235 / CBS 4417 / NBRC 1672 / NRRL Y-8282 / UCD 70-5) TaxID=1071381 RepID=G8BZ72_TETPH|nr:hypothetical protein TPHA_0K00660 [Tetrapisispora phaffii CBS 4417]CCE65200.1 hypothetical protein TPHA_0K00660 [Tetrapisispora phaffii CBS 4417]
MQFNCWYDRPFQGPVALQIGMFVVRANWMLSKRAFSRTVKVASSQPIFDPLQLNPIRSGGTSNINSSLKDLNDANKKRKQELLKSSFQLQPKDDALSARMVGVQAGRTVDIFNGNTQNGLRQLSSLVYTNNIPQDRKDQMFYKKPGKVAERKRSLRHRKEFKKGFQRLIEIVKDAKRKGY